MTIDEAKFEIQEMTMAMGPGTARKKAMILEEEYEEVMVYAFTADPNLGESELCPPPIGVHIGEVESAPQRGQTSERRSTPKCGVTQCVQS